MLIFEGIIQIFALYTMAGLSTLETVTSGIQQGIIAMLAIFGSSFSSSWALMSHILTAGILSSRLHDKTYRTAASAVDIISSRSTRDLTHHQIAEITYLPSRKY